MKNFGIRTLTGVHFINSNTGFILSIDSLFKTTNGGLNWIGKGTGGGAVMSKLRVFDELNISIMGQCCQPIYNNGLIARTSDGGNTWSDSYFSPELDFLFVQNMEWLDINTGVSMWVDVGGANYYGRLFKTINSGLSWSEIDIPFGMDYIMSIKYQNADTLYALTSISLFKSTNQGNNWFQASNLGTGFNRYVISCPSFDTMYLGGNNIFRSTNRGMDFTSVFALPSPYLVNNFEFLNVNTGYATGSHKSAYDYCGGYIAKTTNAGLNWVVQTTNTNLFLRDIHFLNENTGWVVGDSGLILKTTTGGTTFINNIGIEIPSKYSLSQNYPNPFNPTTNIKFDVAKLSNVNIVVYDLTGREVQTLVNESLKPGTYETSFDGSQLSSGVYFYRMETSSFVETKKMLLIK